MDSLAKTKPTNLSTVRHGAGQPYVGILAVDVFVRDQDRSLRFFVHQLGFSLAFDARLQSGDRWVAVAPPDGTAVLTLVAPRPDSAEYKLIGRRTAIVLLTENVPATFEEWRRRGVRFLFAPRLRRVRYRPGTTPGPEDGLTPVWGSIFTRFKDVDGNTFSLVGIDEVTREIESRRRLATERIEAERRAAQELEIAKQVQARLFPQTMPPTATLDYAGACVQARQVGGDYHDYLDLGRGRFGFVIADISGKGIAAALLMANLQANFRSQSAIAVDAPERLLRSVNRLFYENTTGSSYATLIFAEYDDETRRLRYANCGHLAALLLRREGGLQKLDSTCTVLGLFEQWECTMAECQLEPGDILALYTDGVTESFNEAGEEFGERRLIEALRQHCDLSPQAAVASIVSEVQRFSPREQYDDITLILAKCRE